MKRSVGSSSIPKPPFRATVEDIELLWDLEPGSLDSALATLRGRPFDSSSNLTDPIYWDQGLLDALYLLAEVTDEINLAVTRIGRAVATRVEQDPPGPNFMTAADVTDALESFKKAHAFSGTTTLAR